MKTHLLPAQSFLFVPGNRPERFDKALASGADAVILDLEDAVAPDAKAAARDAIAQWISPQRPALIRINARATPWFDQDLLLARLDGVAGIVVPKAERAEDVTTVVAAARRKIPVFPLIESALGMWSAMDIAKAAGTARLMFGTLDFIADMGTDDECESLNPHRAQLALISRVAGIDSPVDGVTADVTNLDRLKADVLNGKRHGLGAKLCIHPSQIPVVHECYRPDDREIAWATRVVDSVARSTSGAIAVDGKMVDRPVRLRAEHLLAMADRRR